MRKVFFLISVVFSSMFGMYAQELPGTSVDEDTSGIELAVGDTLEIGTCDSGAFKYLDYFRKTRWQGGEEAYDTTTGSGFYHSFFSTGDFNAEELACSFSGQKFTILGMEVLVNKNTGKDMAVLYLNGPDPNSVIWVDFYEALESAEIGLPGFVGLTE